MRKFLSCLLTAGLYFNAFASDIVVFDAAKNIGTPNAKHIVKHSDSIELNSNKSADFKGCWDLSKNLDFEIDVENLSTVRPVYIRVYLFDESNEKSTPNIPSISAPVGAGERKKITVSFPSPIPDANIAAKLGSMRADPFQHGDRDKYPADLSKIKRIAVFSTWTSAEARFKIRSVVAKDTSDRKFPSWFALDEKKFFPFIDKYGQFKFKDWPGKVRSDSDIRNAIADEEKDLAAHPSPADFNKFGGWTKGPKFDATGHFYVKKVNGKWWLIDPTGALFWSHGVVRVTPSSAITPLDNREFYFENLPAKDSEFALFYTTKDELLAPYYTKRGWTKTYDFSAANIYRKYGGQWREKYADSAHRRLRSWGLNTIANSSDASIFMMGRTPYIDRFELKPPEVPALSGAAGWWWPFPDVFSDKFEKRIEECLLLRKDQLEDPWCLGFFVDNEIHWGSPTTLAKNTLLSPASSAAKKKFMERLKAKYGEISKLNGAWKTSYSDWDDFLAKCEVPKHVSIDDLREFNLEITETYFRKIRDGVKKLAPNKLYMGCRFAGSNELLLRIGAKYCDVLSYNIYRDDLKWFKLPEGIDKPVMIGEFHFGSTDRGPFHPSLVYRTSQKERAQSYYDYVYSALKHPNFIGTHWHQFSDQAATGRFDGENFQVGFTDVTDKPYPETVEKIREIGYKLYETRWAE